MNLAQILLAVLEIFHTQTNHRQRQNRTLRSSPHAVKILRVGLHGVKSSDSTVPITIKKLKMTFSTNSLRQKSHSQANEFVMKITQDNYHHYHSLHTIAARLTQTIKSNKILHYMQTTLLTTIKIFNFFPKLFHTARLILAAEMWIATSNVIK